MGMRHSLMVPRVGTAMGHQESGAREDEITTFLSPGWPENVTLFTGWSWGESHGQRDRTSKVSNRLRHKLVELWLMEALPTRRPHLPQQPEQIERLRTHLRRMANEARDRGGPRRDLGNGHPDVR